jgi:ABC-type amino acid transport substrate-binding protein
VDATQFGPYQLRELIGQGGMGEVYRAFDTRTDRVVALKVLPAHLAGDATFQERFRRESQAAAGLNEPHVVPIHGFGEIDGRLYLDMRLIEGRNLGTILAESKGPPGAEFAVPVIEQVAAALDAAHETGLVHRDVKPSNILITNRDFVYLIDFGLARTAGQTGLTTAGSTLGTVAYMAPERFELGHADARSDVYALTCVLYECLTGSRPYPAESYEQQITGHIVFPPPRPAASNPKLAAFDEVIATGMAKKPEKRYQSAGELAAAARRALNAPVRRARGGSRHSAQRVRQHARPTGWLRTSRVNPPSPRSPRAGGALTHWRVPVVASAVLVLIAGGAAALWWGTHGRGESGSTAAPASAVASIADSVPSDVKATGRLVVGVHLPYAPNEFKNSNGQIVGFEVDLMNAIGRTVGLLPEYREMAFEDIMPGLQSGNLNVGMSSFTDTKERQQKVDFVTFFQAGTLWAQRAASSVDPNAACGLKVGVAQGSIHATNEIPAKSDVCTATGLSPIKKVVFARQDDVTAALVAGQVDAMSADSPVTGFAIKLSAGALKPAGDVVDTAPYGWPVAKGSALSNPLRQALEHLIKTGEYRAIATTWGVDKGMIDNPMINGALG